MTNEFSPTSRYAGLALLTYRDSGGKEVRYVARRFIPQPEMLALQKWHRVSQGERLDHIAAEHLGDPLIFWRLCDANRAMNPPDLTATIGRRLRITLPNAAAGILL